VSVPIIQVEQLSKRYLIGHQRNPHDSLRHRIEDAFRRPWRWARSVLRPPTLDSRPSASDGRATREEFWALKDVSFEVQPGEVLGVIGRNGAGKSTLLKVLSRITEPTHGRIRIRGRVASLLEVGTGFHPDLTGRENVFLNGAILGMTRAEIRRKFDEIVAFSDIEKFLDTPVKRYSSGMYVRLAFAVAAHLEPDILIVDEVLAVGDLQFQNKCLGKMRDVSRQGGRTVLLVSHNMAAIQALCSLCLVLNQGRLTYAGGIQQAVDSYLEVHRPDRGAEWVRKDKQDHREIVYQRITARLSGPQPLLTLHLDIDLASLKPHKPAFLAVDILDAYGLVLMQALPCLDPFIPCTPEVKKYALDIKLPGLIPGRYALSFWVGSHNTETLDAVQEALAFEVVDSPTPGRSFPHSRSHGAIVPASIIQRVE
jgi:lipopolysaccharide transport system ATP-binding protein